MLKLESVSGQDSKNNHTHPLFFLSLVVLYLERDRPVIDREDGGGGGGHPRIAADIKPI